MISERVGACIYETYHQGRRVRQSRSGYLDAFGYSDETNDEDACQIAIHVGSRWISHIWSHESSLVRIDGAIFDATRCTELGECSER